MYGGDECDEIEEDSVQKPLLVDSKTSSLPPYAVKLEDAKRTGLGPDTTVDHLRSSASSGGNASPKLGQMDSVAQDKAAEAGQPIITSPTPPVKAVHHFRDADLSQDLVAAVNADSSSAGAAHARQLNGFFTVLSLCHTVLTTLDPLTGKIEYKAQSPDEAALVQAAADMGFVFRGREKEILYLQTPFHGSVPDNAEDRNEVPRHSTGSSSSNKNAKLEDQTAQGEHVPGSLAAQAHEGLLERYELLNILEFTSARKRMSVVLRKLDNDDGRLFLLSKGADNVIFERLKPNSQDELKQTTERALDGFASEGLRTLTLAYKVVPGKSSDLRQ